MDQTVYRSLFSQAAAHSGAWDHLVLLPDDALAALCRTNFTRGSGKGGQKRNKTSNAFQISYMEFSVRSENSRSAAINRRSALQKLRMRLALDYGFATGIDPQVRRIADHSGTLKQMGPKPNPKNPVYPLWAGFLIDTFIFFRADSAQTAKALDLSPSKLRRIFETDSRLNLRLKSIYRHFIPALEKHDRTVPTATFE